MTCILTQWWSSLTGTHEHNHLECRSFCQLVQSGKFPHWESRLLDDFSNLAAGWLSLSSAAFACCGSSLPVVSHIWFWSNVTVHSLAPAGRLAFLCTGPHLHPAVHVRRLIQCNAWRHISLLASSVRPSCRLRPPGAALRRCAGRRVASPLRPQTAVAALDFVGAERESSCCWWVPLLSRVLIIGVRLWLPGSPGGFKLLLQFDFYWGFCLSASRRWNLRNVSQCL